MIGHLSLLLGQVPQITNVQWWMFIVYAFAIIAALVVLVLLIFIPIYGKLWFQAFMSDADVSFTGLVGMGFRQVNPARHCPGKDHDRASRTRY